MNSLKYCSGWVVLTIVICSGVEKLCLCMILPRVLLIQCIQNMIVTPVFYFYISLIYTIILRPIGLKVFVLFLTWVVYTGYNRVSYVFSVGFSVSTHKGIFFSLPSSVFVFVFFYQKYVCALLDTRYIISTSM